MNKAEAKDCVGRTVINYALGCSMTKEKLAPLSKYGEIRYYEKSQLYKLDTPHRFILTGTLNTGKVSVTYKDANKALVSELEALLESCETGAKD